MAKDVSGERRRGRFEGASARENKREVNETNTNS